MRRPAQSVERAVFTDSTLILPMASLKTKKEQHNYQVPANHRGKNHHTCIKLLIIEETYRVEEKRAEIATGALKSREN